MSIDVSSHIDLAKVQTVSTNAFLSTVKAAVADVITRIKGDSDVEASIRELQAYSDAELSEMGIARSHIQDVVLNGRK